VAVYCFENFELDVGACELRRSGEVLRLERRPMDLLILLVERRNELVTREEIVQRLWGERPFVEIETGINTAVRKVRHALGDLRQSPKYVQTVPARGYRFLPDVQLRQEQIPAEPLLRIAVLPFENIGADPEREYFADGLTDETIISLGQIDPLRLAVVGRTFVIPYKRTAKPADQIAQELNVGYIVEGTIRSEGPRLRVACKLIRVRDQAQVWSISVDTEGEQVLDFQRELCTGLAEKIALQLSPGTLDRLSRRHTRDPEAYDLYLRGRYYWNQLSPPTTRRALEYYKRATERDPRYALAWSGLADAHASAPINGDAEPRSAGELARAAARRAEAADSRLAEVQTSLGFVKLFIDWEWPTAEAHFRRAVALDPAYPLAHRMLAVALTHLGQQDAARSAIRRARELDIYAMHYSLSAMIEIHAREPLAAVAFGRHAVAIAPDFWIGHYHLALAYEQNGELERALEALITAARISGGNSKALGMRGYVLAKLDRESEAREVLASLEAIARERFIPPYGTALTLLGLGDLDRSLEQLELGYERRDTGLMFLPVDPKWDPLRGHERFERLLRRCNFRQREQRST
jgi:TolB-like protein